MDRLGPGAFHGERLRRAGDWAVCFSADWCPFCRTFLRPFERLQGNVPFGLAIGDVTDLESPLWETFRIEIVPTLVAFRDGRIVWRRDGIAGVGLDSSDLSDLARAWGSDGPRREAPKNSNGPSLDVP
jgi:hypothetical protein